MKILRINQLQKLLGISRATLYRMIKSGSLPQQVKITQRIKGWRETDIHKWIDERQLKLKSQI